MPFSELEINILELMGLKDTICIGGGGGGREGWERIKVNKFFSDSSSIVVDSQSYYGLFKQTVN